MTDFLESVINLCDKYPLVELPSPFEMIQQTQQMQQTNPIKELGSLLVEQKNKLVLIKEQKEKLILSLKETALNYALPEKMAEAQDIIRSTIQIPIDQIVAEIESFIDNLQAKYLRIELKLTMAMKQIEML